MADEQQVRTQLHRGLTVGALLVAVVVCGLGLVNLLKNLDRYPVPVTQLGAFAALVAVLASVRKRSWLAVAVVLAASALSYLTLPDGRTSTGVDWAFGAANWVGLVVLLDRPLRTQLAFLAAHELLAAANLLLFQDVTRQALVRFATGSVTVVGFPLCVAVVAGALRRIGTQAAVAAREIELARTAEAVAAAAHRRRAQRFAELNATSVPLLEGLAGGSLQPSDPAVQRACAIEAARMRRLFAETDHVANPLVHELRHCADVADRKGVEVELDVRGRWPSPPRTVRRDLTDAALTALATAESRARVTVVGSSELVSVSVVADCDELTAVAPRTPGVHIETWALDGTVWMEARWQPNSPSRP